ncbi:tetratricopeptide repeat protein [Desmospora activa]|uniref:Tetratricopeptide repeat protein n=1 Tax=Desmospora activa DSM 45169 TaxID=1121389 RepID=A0A2T4ZDL7_9BACL|nr:tetratricopeptide repeat protein [Desmospora activa]PTM59983.1 tetratricopeptide repeat protein [Desmospora activa DSM 45169]
MAGLGTATKVEPFRPKKGDHRQTEGDPSVTRYYELARLKYEKKKFPEALGAIEKLLGQDPFHAGGLLLHALILEAAGRVDESRSRFEHVLANHPTLSQAYREFGRYLLWREQALQSAESHLLRGLTINPQDSFAHALLANVYVRTNRKQQAVLHLEIASRQPVDDIRYIETCADVLGRLGEGSEEVRYLLHTILSNSRNRVLKNRVRKALRSQEKSKGDTLKRVFQRVWS